MLALLFIWKLRVSFCTVYAYNMVEGEEKLFFFSLIGVLRVFFPYISLVKEGKQKPHPPHKKPLETKCNIFNKPHIHKTVTSCY